MPTPDETRDSLARVLDPDSWRLRDAPNYRHLPQIAQDSLVARSREQADAVMGWLADQRAAASDALATLANDLARTEREEGGNAVDYVKGERGMWADVEPEVRRIHALLDGTP